LRISLEKSFQFLFDINSTLNILGSYGLTSLTFRTVVTTSLATDDGSDGEASLTGSNVAIGLHDENMKPGDERES